MMSYVQMFIILSHLTVSNKTIMEKFIISWFEDIFSVSNTSYQSCLFCIGNFFIFSLS